MTVHVWFGKGCPILHQLIFPRLPVGLAGEPQDRDHGATEGRRSGPVHKAEATCGRKLALLFAVVTVAVVARQWVHLHPLPRTSPSIVRPFVSPYSPFKQNKACGRAVETIED